MRMLMKPFCTITSSFFVSIYRVKVKNVVGEVVVQSKESIATNKYAIIESVYNIFSQQGV